MKKKNFKLVIYTLLLAVLLPLVCVFVSPINNEESYAIDSFIVQSEENKVTMVSGDFVGTNIQSSEDALDMLNDFKETFNFSSSREALVFNKCVESITGFVYKFDQYKDGLRVYGGELNVNVTNSGKAKSIIGCYYTDVAYSSEINYTKEQAEEKLLQEFPSSEISFVEEVIVVTNESGYVAYIFEARSNMETIKVFISARTLNITRELSTSSSLRDSIPTTGYTIENVATAQTNYKGENITLYIDKYTSTTSSEYFYILADKERQIYITNGENRESYSNYKYYDSYYESGYMNDPAAVQAYEYIMQCYEFYADVNSFGLSIEGVRNPNNDVINLIAIVHYGSMYENAACYVPSTNSKVGYFVFGDGNSLRGTDSFVQALDVVGHEYQHSVTDTVVMLDYINESGAICEAYSDIFGAVIEGYELDDPNFWRMGEDIYGNGDYFRDMSNPSSKEYCAYSYDNLFPLCTSNSCSHSDCDRGGVHYNCTLLTYATYIMYQQNPEHFNKTNILKLWYQTLTKLTSQATFIQFAAAMIDAANDLGYTSDQIRDIEFAFAAVNIPGYTGVETWNGNTLTYFQGSGTTANPYLINSVADLASLAYYVNNNSDEGAYATATYKLNVDLNLNNVNWIGIGTYEYPFNGTFNGGSYTINNLNITGNSGDVYTGLFRYTSVNAYIYDLNIGAGNVTTTAEYAGAVVGRLMGSITGCSSALNIKGNNVGGLVGLAVNQLGGKIITNCFTTSDLEGNIVGGLVARFATQRNEELSLHFAGYIASSYTTGTLTGLVVGGLVGQGNGLYLANNITLSTLIAKNSASTLGGFIGKFVFKNPIVANDTITEMVPNYILSCKSTAGFVSETGAKVGLAIGEISGEINEGKVYIENTIVKQRETYALSSSGLTANNVKVVNTTISTDSVYQGVFDFDSEKYYKNTKNWTIMAGIESFDLVTTYSVTGENKMPTFYSADFWLNSSAYGFAGGEGTESSPYKISSAGQLAFLANLLMTDAYYNQYSTKYYELTNDIDMAGKIWAGIGFTKYVVTEGVTTSATLYPFRGSFNGNGHTIYNMTSLGLYSVKATNTTGSSYILYEFSPALFGVTSSVFSGTTMVNPSIKNVTFEDVNIRGNYASAAVSKAYYAIDIENVTVMGGTISSAGIAGGIVAKIDSISKALTSSSIAPISNIKNCYTLVNIDGNVVGGAVGYVTNASTNNASTLNIINHLNRGTITTAGENSESVYESGSYVYYRATAGSLVGVTLIKNLNLINCMNLGNVISYSENPMIGGFIGAVGVGDSFAQQNISITIDGCKQAGKIYYIFDNLLTSAGSVLGATHAELGTIVTLTISERTYNVQENPIVEEYESGTITIDSDMHVTSDKVGEGVFDIYNEDYYNDSQYFNPSHYWTSEQTSRFYYTIVFKAYNDQIGDFDVFETITVKEGETVTLPTAIPERESTAAYDYEFIGWSEDLTNIDRNMTVYAEYKATTRSYVVTYVDRDGNTIGQLTLEYGSSVNQDVEAPEKESNFFFKYTFLRWGQEGQTVTGDVQVSAVYKSSLTGTATAIVFAVAIVIFAGVVAIVSKKKIA